MTDDTTRQELRNRVKSWLAAFNAKDREKLYALFHPEMIYANDGAPLMRGAAEIKPWYEQAFKSMSARALFKEEAIVADNNMAFVVGKFYFEPAADNAPAGEAGRVAMVWRRDESGQWLLAFDMDNRPPDSTPADFVSASKTDAYTQPG